MTFGGWHADPPFDLDPPDGPEGIVAAEDDKTEKTTAFRGGVEDDLQDGRLAGGKGLRGKRSR